MALLQLLSEGGPDTSLAWVLWITLGVFLLAIVAGWITSRGREG